MAAESQPTRKVAFLTGVTGQDGSYLSEFLLEKGYEVHGALLFFLPVSFLRVHVLSSAAQTLLLVAIFRSRRVVRAYRVIVLPT